jgi:hypothetical protein
MASKRTRRWYIALIIVLGLYVAYRCTLHLMVQAKLDEIRKQGYPVTLAELDKWYPQPPPGENAADTYLKAFALFSSKQASDTNLPIVGDTRLPRRGWVMDEDMKREIADYLGKNSQALALLHTASGFSRCRYPIDLTNGSATLLPHLTSIHKGVRLLLLEAIFRAQNGEADQAVRSVLCSLALANSLTAEPLEISQLTRLTGYREAATYLSVVLSRVTPSENSLKELENAFSNLRASEGLLYGNAGERCLGIDFCKRPTESIIAMLGHATPPPYLKQKVLFFRVTGCLDIFLLRYLKDEERYREVCSMPLPEGVKQTKNADPAASLTQLLLICFLRLGEGSIIQVVGFDTAQVDACRTGLAIERHRLSNSNLPNKLDELVPAYLATIPVDPFDGQLLRYKKLAKGYVVYSVGEDGKDDGGDEKKDITFTVER